MQNVLRTQKKSNSTKAKAIAKDEYFQNYDAQGMWTPVFFVTVLSKFSDKNTVSLATSLILCTDAHCIY